MRIPQPIPYQGSKRNLADRILSYFPDIVELLIEPFTGSAAISIAAAYHGSATQFHLNDINEPLMNLLSKIIEDPDEISDQYEALWHQQTGDERGFYKQVRDDFNCTNRPDLLLYLLARCVKAAVRYNARGGFSQSPDNRRKGRSPQNMRLDIETVSRLLKGRTLITSLDYKQVLAGDIGDNNIIYMDPPYQGVCTGKDPRYFCAVDPQEFSDELRKLTERNVMFIVSYDGRLGVKQYGRVLPSDLGMVRIEIEVGRSSQSTLLGRDDVTFESLYLSSTLVKRTSLLPIKLNEIVQQLNLFV